jgi:transposase-like protein
MTIVPIGNLIVQVPEVDSPDFVLQIVKQIEGTIPAIVGRMVDECLEVEVERFLGRGRYRRRKQAKRQAGGAYCSRCRSHQRQDFRRNGHYERSLATHWGAVVVQLPQVECQCGGNVKMSYRTVPPRQRFWEDVQLEVVAEYGRGLSYRQIKVDLDQRLGSSVGMRTLNQYVLGTGQAREFFAPCLPGACPPVVRVDGIWITILFTTGEMRLDRLGRRRPVKRAQRIPILAAQGVWPTTGETRLLAWMRTQGEDTPSWQSFLERLDAAGYTREHGLALLVADGSKGFRAAYENIYWQVPFQRCVFHKLRNLAGAIRPPAELDRQAAHDYRTQCLRSAAQIWQAPDEDQARERYEQFCHTWQAVQPKVVATLQRDFADTLAFYAVQQQAAERGEHWPAHHLRTTSPLERMFREFRRRYRSALLFHSETGADATTARIAVRFS